MARMRKRTRCQGHPYLVLHGVLPPFCSFSRHFQVPKFCFWQPPVRVSFSHLKTLQTRDMPESDGPTTIVGKDTSLWYLSANDSIVLWHSQDIIWFCHFWHYWLPYQQKMQCIQRYLHFYVHFSSHVLQISRDTMHVLSIFFSKNDREIEPVVLHTINPMNSTKWVTSFSWIFHFSLIDFSKKIFEIFFNKCLMPWGYVDLCTGSK